ncbi:unnamed protein product [Psylliodes chrysocephalus]|uniref:Uncharacterized protein n=1 Tax=Psylliodes chrysocephalus TaxID=3402493 RepID=A0A9P0DA71_9CUCU|nr:unnamed protein product [Psylliodes chrysocephala]
MFQTFWNTMTWSERKLHVQTLVQCENVKRRRGQQEVSKINYSTKYFLKLDLERIRVCKQHTSMPSANPATLSKVAEVRSGTSAWSTMLSPKAPESQANKIDPDDEDVMDETLPQPDVKAGLSGGPKTTLETSTGSKSIQGRHTSGLDQFKTFGELVGLRIKDLPSSNAQKIVKHLISNILFEAEMGKYDYGNPLSGNYSQPFYPIPNYVQQPILAPMPPNPNPYFEQPSFHGQTQATTSPQLAMSPTYSILTEHINNLKEEHIIGKRGEAKRNTQRAASPNGLEGEDGAI